MNLPNRIVLAVLGVLVAGLVVVGLLHRGDPTHAVTDPVHRFQTTWQQQGARPVPACARTWPPTCPDTRSRPVPPCGRHWPPTCHRKEPHP